MFQVYSYFDLLTKSGKLISRNGKLKDSVKFAGVWIRESPYHDPGDPLRIEEVVFGGDGQVVERKIVKEF